MQTLKAEKKSGPKTTIFWTIADKDNKIYYQLDGQELNDLQTLYFEKGSYIIQIVADDYTEDIISLNYNVKIEN